MEPVIHLLIPLVLILAFNKDIDRRKVMGYSLLALFPDVDFFFGHAVFHNIFAPLGLSSVIYHIKGRDKTAWKLSMFFLVSHLILDLGFVALLYPIEHKVYTVDLNIYTSPKVFDGVWEVISGNKEVGYELSSIVKSESGITHQPLISARMSEVSPLFTQTGLMLVLLMILTAVFTHFRGLKKDGKE